MSRLVHKFRVQKRINKLRKINDVILQHFCNAQPYCRNFTKTVDRYNCYKTVELYDGIVLSFSYTGVKLKRNLVLLFNEIFTRLFRICLSKQVEDLRKYKRQHYAVLSYSRKYLHGGNCSFSWKCLIEYPVEFSIAHCIRHIA